MTDTVASFAAYVALFNRGTTVAAETVYVAMVNPVRGVTETTAYLALIYTAPVGGGRRSQAMLGSF